MIYSVSLSNVVIATRRILWTKQQLGMLEPSSSPNRRQVLDSTRQGHK